MHRGWVITFVLLGLAGAYLLGRGLTGNVVSQSCCFPPNCAPENLCDAAEPNVEQPAVTDTGLGAAIIICVLVLFFMLKSIPHHHEQ